MKINIPHIENYNYTCPVFKQYEGDVLQQESIGYSISSMTVKNVVSLYYGTAIDEYICTNEFFAHMFGLPNVDVIEKMLPANPYQPPKNELIEYICKSYVISNNLMQNCNVGGIGNKSIESIKTMINRVLSFFNNKKVYMLNKEFYLVDDAIAHIVVSIKKPKIRESFIKLFDSNFNIKEEPSNINRLIIFNPRQNNSIEIDFDKNEEFNNKKNKERNKKISEKIEIFKNKLKDNEINISLNDFNSRYEEALQIKKTLKKESFLKSICNLMSLYDCSFEDAYDAFVYDLEYGIVRGINEIRYNGEIYKSKMDAYKKLLKKYDPNKVSYAVMQRMRYHNISWEEALEQTIANPPSPLGDEIKYKRKKYSSKKTLINELFPNRSYESVMYSISRVMSEKSISFSEAIDEILNSDSERGFMKRVEYNGVTYKSIREAGRKLNIGPQKLSYHIKMFDGDSQKAIDYILNGMNEVNK